MARIGRDAEPAAEVTLEDALEIAVRAHRAGDVAVATALYGRILDAAPDCAPALHFSGILHHQTGRHLDAVRLIRQAIAITPGEAGLHSNLGNVLFEIDRPDLAVQAYETAIALDPGMIPARNNLGVALRTLRRVDEAEAVYREAIDLDPTQREAWDNLGRLLAGRGQIEAAIRCHARALELEPSNAVTRRFLIAAYAATNEAPRALALVRDWLAEDPGSASAQHLLAAISGEDVPDRASDRYVETLFDSFADSFDHKLARLDYRAPDLITAAVAALHAPEAALAVLDAGCGTGLCGAGLRPFARALDGVDLSVKMLDKARQRQIYDQLHQGELIAFLRAHRSAYDLVVSADTLCYFGRLDPVCEAAHGALRPGGRLVFSVEEVPGDGFTLHPHGRYGHALTYLERTLGACGFRIERLDRETLRLERGDPVVGLIASAVR